MFNTPKWVILAYLNGNNELEPEISAAKKEIENTSIENNLQIIIQIGRLCQNTVKIIRPEFSTEQSEDNWDGVRRYASDRTGMVFLEDLGYQNMASPLCLYDFLIWGMSNFEAEHYLLFLGGHACEYIGLMDDYSQEKPYILGIPELSLVLETVKNTVGKTIDILLCDTCYFNNIEVLYELGQSGSAINTVILHSGNAPASGLSCRELITAIDTHFTIDNGSQFVQKIIENLSSDLIAYRVDATELEHIKKLFSSLAFVYLEQQDRDFLPVLRDRSQEVPGQEIIDGIIRSISALIVGQKIPFCQLSEAIRVLDKYIPDKTTAVLYYRLAFARDNRWTKLLCSRLPERSFQFAVSVGFSPLELGISKIKALIRSSVPTLTEEDAERILRRLIVDRHWEI